MGRYSYNYWAPYVSAAKRRRQAEQKIVKMKKAGHEISPIEISGRKMTETFWGDAWCKNLEAYSDYSNRLPRGRTYVRNGSVIDLRIKAGQVQALVSGSHIYKVDIEIKPLDKKRWTDIKGLCAGRIDSLVELLKGSISKSVMEIVTRKGEGLFPSPQEIKLRCSCPDWAVMCKHVAATLYGVGARLDHEPELLFILRGVDPAEMVETAIDRPLTGSKPQRGRRLESDELSAVFGIEIDTGKGTADDVSTPAGSSGQAKHRAPVRSKRSKEAMSGTAKKKTQTKTASKKASVKKPAVKSITKKTVAIKPAQITSKPTKTQKTASKRKSSITGQPASKKTIKKAKK